MAPRYFEVQYFLSDVFGERWLALPHIHPLEHELVTEGRAEEALRAFTARAPSWRTEKFRIVMVTVVKEIGPTS